MNGSFSNPSYAFRAQEWFDPARDDVLGLRGTPPLVSFLAGSLLSFFFRKQFILFMRLIPFQIYSVNLRYLISINGYDIISLPSTAEVMNE
jgi:hypothetical protein